MENNIKETINILTKALKKDEDYRRSWQANIAMCFKDECYRSFKESLYTEYKDAPGEIHKIANKASINFLNLLCKNGAEKE